MLKVENVETFNLEGALRGMRNSWESWNKSDSEKKIWFSGANFGEKFVVGEADLKLAKTLAKAGSEHAKYLRQILISFDLIAPLKFFDEFDQYHFFTSNSTSIMHTLGRGEITADAFSFEDVPEEIVEQYIDLINRLRDRWIAAGKKKPSPEWRALVMFAASGFNYRRTITTNYGQLRSMYFQRKNHRLSEWREFAEWIESLPYSELITLADN